jgi:hypothetical protein
MAIFDGFKVFEAHVHFPPIFIHLQTGFPASDGLSMMYLCWRILGVEIRSKQILYINNSLPFDV